HSLYCQDPRTSWHKGPESKTTQALKPSRRSVCSYYISWYGFPLFDLGSLTHLGSLVALKLFKTRPVSLPNGWVVEFCFRASKPIGLLEGSYRSEMLFSRGHCAPKSFLRMQVPNEKGNRFRILRCDRNFSPRRPLSPTESQLS